MLEVIDLQVFYGEIHALKGVSLRVEQGEIVALLGNNGAGKTTTLKTISGLLRPRLGQVLLEGQPVQALPPHEIVARGVAHAPEGRKIFNRLTVLENLEMGAYPLKAWTHRRDTMEKVYHIFPRLKERKRQVVKTLSGGEKQMVAIGRGLMSRPKLCMFDEPSYGLAPKAVHEIFKVIKQLPEQGITVLLIEQNVKQALELAHRACVLENGRLTLEGPCCDLIRNDHVRKAYLGL